MQYFANKVIWITGASSGIGAETAKQLSHFPNTSLILSARRVDKLEEIKSLCEQAGAKCAILPIDLEQTDLLEAKAQEAIACFGHIDILVNNGGISQRSSVLETPIENDRKIMEIDYFSTVILTKAVLPQMLSRKTGHIIAISSISGVFGFPLRSAYCAAKHAMYGFFEALDIEVRKQGIAVTIVSPGRIQTDISYSALTKDGTPHGKMDKGQEEGMPVDVCIKKMLRAVSKQKHEALIGGKEVILAHIYRKLPRLFHKIAANVKPT